MKILIACEFSGVVREAFIRLGHDAYSCDLLPSRKSNGKHTIGDVRPLLKERWDMVIAHPPCTYLSNAGARHFINNPVRYAKMLKGVEFFRRCLEANAPRVCVENPIPIGEVIKILRRKYTQIVQPWMFGHGETKATCLWLKGLPKLKPTNVVTGRFHGVLKIHGINAAALRSITFLGIAEAMAEQWGRLLE